MHDVQLHAVIFGMLLNQLGIQRVLRPTVRACLDELRIARGAGTSASRD
jgi:hypothetical protein